MEISNTQHDKAQEILNAVSTLVILNTEYPEAVAFTLATLMPERSFGSQKVKPSIPVLRNKVLAEIILKDDLNEQSVKADVAARKKS